MPQPPDVRGQADLLVAVYVTAWTHIETELESIRTNPAAWRRRARLRQFQREVESLMAQVDEQARRWLSTSLPPLYALGAEGAASALGSTFRWTAPHTAAVQALASDTFADLLAATAHVGETTKRLVRELTRTQIVAQVAAGKGQNEAIKGLQETLERQGVTAVVYSDGSRHGLGEYSSVVIRTKAALVFNAGAINQASSLGTEFMECLDGLGCGLDGHDDPRLANGLILSVSEAADNPLSHPNCTRAWSPRPDIRTAEEAAAGEATPRPSALASTAAP